MDTLLVDCFFKYTQNQNLEKYIFCIFLFNYEVSGLYIIRQYKNNFLTVTFTKQRSFSLRMSLVTNLTLFELYIQKCFFRA
jgi:hypothetical protein